MFTSMMALVLAAQVQATGAEISWTQDYKQAQKEAQSQKKPLAVVLASGDQGYTQLGLSKEAMDQLGADYICVYLDTANPKNKDLVTAFELPGGKGIVLSDRTGMYENYRREGMLSATDMTAQLKYYASMPVSSSTSYYQPAAGGAYAQPAYGSYCPSCQRGYR